ncbi:acetyl-CoA carboxylase biotin carboxyl carrier protein subunit [Rhodonellum sp.]|uniref:acetyl-CoA carboxylase biotin carboxyl carrier protein subunit n=1 Tax=Rhodonellum sp. TaxID=2231180 RepID=UPI00271A283B|nr:acetyl-CoA carboxylase biotin carboxyl carrier protein subunit [Rhodonellum sp.]MDO9552000.1 acetyl-CoA carboxylase biotin carboxyl carrier protein subunit [Rhodonellum sp.]
MYSVTIDKAALTVEKSPEGFIVNSEILKWDFAQISENHFHVLHEGKSFNLELISLNAETKTVRIKLNNKVTEVILKDKFDQLLEKLGMNGSQNLQIKDLKAPMPGLIFDIKVKVGDEVKKNDPILILEAMKMENILKSPRDGTIKVLKIKKGDSVEKNQVLIQF